MNEPEWVAEGHCGAQTRVPSAIRHEESTAAGMPEGEKASREAHGQLQIPSQAHSRPCLVKGRGESCMMTPYKRAPATYLSGDKRDKGDRIPGQLSPTGKAELAEDKEQGMDSEQRVMSSPGDSG